MYASEMRIESLRIILLQQMLLTPLFGLGYRERKFKYDPGLPSTTLVLASQDGASLISCGVLCTSHESCTDIKYKESDSECELFNGTSPHTDALIHTRGEYLFSICSPREPCWCVFCAGEVLPHCMLL